MNFFFFNKKEKSILQNQCNPSKTTVVVEAPLLWLVGILFSCFYNNVKKKQTSTILFLSVPSDAYINNATVECFRRKRLDVAHQVEVKVYSFQECLDECMRRYNRDCQSVEYSSRFQSCRFSSQSSGTGKPPNLVDDESYDYYEFKWSKYSQRHPVAEIALALHTLSVHAKCFEEFCKYQLFV